jgi:aromatic-L-amino-acid/L-tryptophan decarboxylase
MSGAFRDSLGELGDVRPEVFRRQLHDVADWIADYREKIAERPISPNAEPGAIVQALPERAPEIGEGFAEIWRDFEQLIVPGMVHWGHPQFMGYFGSTTTAPGILAEMAAAALNVNAMTWRTSPAATELESVVLDWLRQWLSLPAEFRGVLYDTASISTMHALAVARERALKGVRQLGLTGRNLPILRIYASEHTHSSVEKAAIALGVGETNVQRVATDSAFRLDLDALRRMIDEDRARNFLPIAVVATVGTTSTASVDPVAAIAEIARAEKIWLHIDAAYGGGLALLPEAAWVTDGWRSADSLVINPHKMLFVPFDFSALYLREIGELRDLFSLVPEYLRGDTENSVTNYMDYGVQLGRRFRAIKAWMVWRTFGREGLAARIREHLRLAQLVATWIREDSRFELLAPVVMGVVCFAPRAPDSATAERMCHDMVAEINSSGRAYLTLTRLRERSAVRLGLGNILTTEEHLRTVWQLIVSFMESSDRNT